MRYLSLFSGIEACTVAWQPLGWEAVAFAEFDDFPKAVLAHHYPDVPDLGDVTKITEEQIAAAGPIDLVVGGSPCQNLSVAGNREGLDGEQSSLFVEQVRIFDIARRRNGARYLLWENVPGAFSTNGGHDFAHVLGAMAGGSVLVPQDGWKNSGVALGTIGLVEWRVLDAQHFGVPQRRRRIFALLDTGAWWSREPILFEQEGSCGDTSQKSGESREGATTRVRESSQSYCILGNMIGRKDEHGPQFGSGVSEDVSYTLNTTDRHAVAYEEGRVFASSSFGGFAEGVGSLRSSRQGDENLIVEDERKATALELGALSRGQGSRAWDDVAPTLRAEMGDNLVSVMVEEHPSKPIVMATGQANAEILEDQCSTLTTVAEKPIVVHKEEAKTVVRRLTPMECERLQGFPDGYTNIPWRGKDDSPDSRRYKALGNSMAVPVMRWIAERIDGTQPIVRDEDEIRRVMYTPDDMPEGQLGLF